MPHLIEVLALAGQIITLDAMGTHTHIAEAVIEKKADYILALKGNQGTPPTSLGSVFGVSPRSLTGWLTCTEKHPHISMAASIGQITATMWKRPEAQRFKFRN